MRTRRRSKPTSTRAGVSDLLATLGGLALSAFLAATFLPGTTEVVLAGLVLAADIEPWLLITVASVFNVLGSAVNFVIGHYLARLQGSRFMPVGPDQLARARRWFQRYGVWALLMSWLPFIGDALPVVAGYMRANPWVAFPLIAIGKTARFVAVVWAAEAGSAVIS